MLIFLVLMSLVIISVGFIINDKNAKHLLNGYNNLSTEQQAKLNIKSYLHFFKRFHIALGISLLAFGLCLYWLQLNSFLGIFIGLYPVVMYIYFAWRTAQFYKNGLGTSSSTLISYLSVGILIMVTIGTGILLYAGTKDSSIELHDTHLHIGGMYSENIAWADIQSLSLVDSLPPIIKKNNGFSLGNSHKGYYKCKDGSTVKLLLNSKQRPFLLIQRQTKPWVYFSQQTESTEALFSVIKKHMRQ